jgi:hypothetical protein
MKNRVNIGNRGNEKSDHKYTCDILNKMRKKVYKLKCFKDSKFSHYIEETARLALRISQGEI